MKRQLGFVKVLVVVMAMVLIGAGAAWAGQFPALDAGIKQARDRTPVINARLAAEQYAINQRYKQQQQQRDLERQMETQALVVKPVDEGGKFPQPLKTVLLFVPTGIGTFMMAAGEGVNYVSGSRYETPLSQGCRGLNTGKNQIPGHFWDFGKEFVTSLTGNTQYANPAKLNYLGQRTMEHGPFAQMAETAGTVIPPIAAATVVVGPVLGFTVVEMAIATGVVSSVGSVGVGEGFDYVEKTLVK